MFVLLISELPDSLEKHIAMTKFDKKDIPSLDFIINKLVEFDNQIGINDLIKNDFIIDDDSNKPYVEYNRLASIIHSYNCADVFFSGEIDLGTTIRVNKNTSNFVCQGGFKNAYTELLDEIEHSLVIKRKERNESMLARWQVITFWPLFFIAILGGVYSCYDYFVKSKNTEERFLKIEGKLESTLKSLKENNTLILNLKKDSPSVPTNSVESK